jgi:CheY-like chemotaxis protein
MDGASVTPSPAPARIMVVEDEAGDVYLLREALSDHRINYELTCFEDGDEAICGLDAGFIPDLILVDLNLPRRDGFDVLRAIATVRL